MVIVINGDQGCWKDDPKFTTNPGKAYRAISGEYPTGYTVSTCQNKAKLEGKTIAALQANGHCFTGNVGTDEYFKYGKVDICKETGDDWVNRVFINYK